MSRMSSHSPDLLCAAQVCLDAELSEPPLFPFAEFSQHFIPQLHQICATQRQQILHIAARDGFQAVKEELQRDVSDKQWSLLPREVFFSTLCRLGFLCVSRSIDYPNTILSGVFDPQSEKILMQGSSPMPTPPDSRDLRRLHGEFFVAELPLSYVRLPPQPSFNEYVTQGLEQFRCSEIDENPSIECEVMRCSIVSVQCLCERSQLHRPLPRHGYQEFASEIFNCHSNFRYAVRPVIPATESV